MPEGARVLLDDKVEHVRGLLDAIVGHAPLTLLEVRRRLVSGLQVEPRPQVLQAIAALSEIENPAAKATATRAVTRHLVVEKALADVWDRLEIDPASLQRSLSVLPTALELGRDETAAIDVELGSLDRLQRDATARLVGTLVLPEEPFHAALAVVPELVRLCAAVREGRLSESAPYLAPDELEVLSAAAIPDGTPGRRADRALVNAIALRSAIEREVAASPEVAPEESSHERRIELRRAHSLVSHRLDALRNQWFERAKAADKRLDAARKRLFSSYLSLTKALAEEPTEAEAEVRARIVAAEQAAALIDAEKASTEGLMNEASSRAGEPLREDPVPTDMQDLARERRRKKILMGIAAALVPIAIGVNIVLFPHKDSARISLEMLNGAMPVKTVVPIGGVLYSEIATFLWDGMSETEQKDKVEMLGRVAARQGFRAIIIVDDNRVERGYWSATSGVTLRAVPPEPTTSTAPAQP